VLLERSTQSIPCSGDGSLVLRIARTSGYSRCKGIEDLPSPLGSSIDDSVHHGWSKALSRLLSQQSKAVTRTTADSLNPLALLKHSQRLVAVPVHWRRDTVGQKRARIIREEA
jgi:hypothetical protein